MKRLATWSTVCMMPVWCMAQTPTDTNMTVTTKTQRQTVVLSRQQEASLQRYIEDDKRRQQDRIAAKKTTQTMGRIYDSCDRGEQLVAELEDMINHQDRYIRRYRLEGIERRLKEWESMPESSAKQKTLRVLNEMRQRLTSQQGGRR